MAGVFHFFVRRKLSTYELRKKLCVRSALGMQCFPAISGSCFCDSLELTGAFEGTTVPSDIFCSWQKMRVWSLIACDFSLMDYTEIAQGVDIQHYCFEIGFISLKHSV